MFKVQLLAVVFALTAVSSYAQITGLVTDAATGDPIPSAVIQWEGTDILVLSDLNGEYSIEKPSGSTRLSTAATGYAAVTKSVISRTGTMNFSLTPLSQLEEVDISQESSGTTRDFNATQLRVSLQERELRKAACCNLSESFETNASVDVSFTNAVTGAKQIEMLGLSGKYVLIQRENIPFARALNANSGFSFVPGPFVKSIQLTKGLSSVVYGYESITGQINVEFLQPDDPSYFRLNGFVNQGARFETNAWIGTEISDFVDMGTLVHYSNVPFAQDRNNDQFADMPAGQQINIHNRWKYLLNEQWGGQAGFMISSDNRTSGQTEAVFENPNRGNPWLFNQSNNRYEVFGKNGYVDPNAPARSVGIVYNLSMQNSDYTIGDRSLYANQESGYVNAIYQDILSNTFHQIRAGLSYQYDYIEEGLDTGILVSELRFNRTEHVAGVFGEYTYSGDGPITIVAGGRIDYHNLFGWIATPRLNVKYEPITGTVFRVSAGRGQRTPNILTENLNALASGRTFAIQGLAIDREVAWNYGASFSQAFLMFDRGATFTLDAFYTQFENKLITEWTENSSLLETYYNWDAGSRSTSILAQIDFEPFKNFDVRLAYKYLRSLDAFKSGTALSYKVPTHRAFINLGYTFGESGWKVDATYNWFGEQRLPLIFDPALGENLSPTAEPFGLLHTQVNKTFGKRWEVYIGGDNMLDFRQDSPIIDAANPFSSNFETNRVYAPIFGRMIYAGFYYNIDR